MPRSLNTTINGTPFDAATIRAVWNSATPIFGYDAKVWRLDPSGHTIKFDDFAKETSEFGWHIDHIKPVALRGFDGLSNLEPLQWRINALKSDKYPFAGIRPSS